MSELKNKKTMANLFEDKMKRLTSELPEMFTKSNELQDEIKKNLSSIGFEVKQEKNTMTDLTKGQIVIYENNGNSNLEVIQEDNTLWLSAEKIAKLFGKDRTTIQRHIAKIYKGQELEENSTCAFIAQVQKSF